MSIDYLTYNKLSSEQFKLHNINCNSMNQFLHHCMSNFCESTTNEMLYKIINKSLYLF